LPSTVDEKLGKELGELLGEPLGDNDVGATLGVELGPELGEEVEPVFGAALSLGDELGLAPSAFSPSTVYERYSARG
jgi:hypothetical protein